MRQGNRSRSLAWRIVSGLALLLGAYIIFLLALAFIHRRPPETTNLPIEGGGNSNHWPARLNLLTWNLGYGGTGEEADLFMEGGRDVLAKDKSTVLRHLQNIIEVLQQHPEELYLLQEVDLDSRRTYHVNEVELITRAMKNFDFSMAFNYDVWFVPYPFTRPTGQVRSGLLSLGSYHVKEATRVQLPGSFPWPISAFALDRCLLVWRLPRDDGKEWLIVNVHLAAWDADGRLRKQELSYLRGLALYEYGRGNSVIIGGDWNSVLPGVRRDQFPSQDKPSSYMKDMPQDLFPGTWHWGVPAAHPTNRQVNAPYVPGKSFVTVIDGFLVSPNVQILAVNAIPLGFKDSDHEPVTISVGERD